MTASVHPSAALRARLERDPPAALYVVVGDDEPEKARVVAVLTETVDETVRAFNAQRFDANDADPAEVVAAARTLPLLGERRLVVVTRAERWLKRRGGAADEAEDVGPGRAEALVAYLERPEPLTCLVLAASDLDRGTRLGKRLAAAAVVVSCWGLKDGRELRGEDAIRRALDRAAAWVRSELNASGLTITGEALRRLLAHTGPDLNRLRGDVEKLALYCTGRKRVGLGDVYDVVGGETLIDEWAIKGALQRGAAGQALRLIRLALEAGAPPFKVLGQLEWIVRDPRTRFPAARLRRAIDALFQTDLALKTSAGDPLVLMERLVIELCGVAGRDHRRAAGVPATRPGH